MAWKKTRIGEFLFEREGKYKPDSEAIAGLKRIDKIDFSGNFYIAKKPSRTNMILICPGDLVISGINVAKGAMGIYRGNEDVTATIHYSSYIFDKSKIDVGYFKRFLKSDLFIRLLQEQVKGGIKTEIKPKHILPLEIDLPNIKEQREIVAHFKSIETEDAELKAELTHQQTLLKKIRQSILQEAIEGKLTADWRQQNADVEPASELLARIQAEKEQLIKDKKIKKQKPLPPISEEEKPFALPEGWEWCRYYDVMLDIEAGKSPTCYNYPARHDEWGVLKISAISWDAFRENENKKLKPHILPFVDKEVKSGDFIMTRANTKELVAKSVVVGNVRSKLLLNDKTLRVLFTENVDLLFMNFFNNGDYARTYYISVSTGASPSMKNISRDNIKRLILPLPPFDEQRAIVAKTEKLLTLCDQLETQITQNQTHTEQLMQAVLKEAFQQNNSELEPEKAEAYA
jgi:type I restriction enzyme, S subunit